jgi:phage baseplate assembly protein W
MATFIGFNTQGQYRKFTLTDRELIKRDLLNALNIRRGSVPGRPDVGTSIWDNLFENITDDLVQNLNAEMQRVAGGDPRLRIDNLYVYPQLNGILIEIELSYVPSADAERLRIFFDQETRRASYL